LKIASANAPALARSRWDALDIARGVAILAMIVYHFGWDLSFLKLIQTDLIRDPVWRWFARGIAGSFLALAGLGLVLAHARGFRLHSFLTRLLRIAGAAALITVATYFVFPESYIFFGILHCIAVTSVLALPFLRAPLWTIAIAAGLCFAAPVIAREPFWDHAWLDWLGLGAQEPFTNDYVPIFPWFGLVLLGLAVGRLLPAFRAAAPSPLPVQAPSPGGPLSRGLAWVGRKSLPIYLTHQVILFGILYGLVQVVGPNPVAEARPVLEQCRASCRLTVDSESSCRTYCSCVVDRLRGDEAWPKVLSGSVGPDEQTRISRFAQQCLRESPPP
jgi:uncharacterized membrane protein